MRRNLYLFVLLVFLLPLFALERTVSYQGKLTDGSGIGITDALDMSFKLYPTSGSALMLDEFTVLGVVVDKGLFSVDLSFELTRWEIFNGLWLEITIDGDIMSPRQRITTEMFAMGAWFADTARYAEVADSVATRRVHYADTAGAVNWYDITEVPADLGGFNQLRAGSGLWLTDSVTLVGGSGMTLTQIGDTIIFESTSGSEASPDSYYVWNQDTIAQPRTDFWIDGAGTFGGTVTYGPMTVTTGTGASGSDNAPFNMQKHFSRSVIMLDAAEISASAACTISELAFNIHSVSGVTEDPWNYSYVTIHMEETPASSVPTTWSTTSATEVLNSDLLSFNMTTGWKTVDITDFDYDGTSNLVIYIQNTALAPYYSPTVGPQWSYTTETSSNLFARASNDAYWETIMIPSTDRPDVRLTISDFPTPIDQVNIFNGSIDGDGDLMMGGDVSASSFTLGGVTLTDWSGLVNLDTISSPDVDTIVVMENLKIHRELIADSIQAVGDTIFLDDNIRGNCALFKGNMDTDVIFLESFSSPTFPPTGWEIDSTNEGQYTWHRSTGDFFTAPAAAGVVAATEEQNERLSTPEIFIPPIGNYFLTYKTSVYYGYDDPGELNEHLVEISTNGGISWSVIVEYRDSLPVGREEWDRLHTVDLASYAGTDVVFSFHTACAAGIYHDWFVDDVSVWAYTGTEPIGVEICDGNITADGDVSAVGYWLDGEYIDSWSSIAASAIRFDTLNATGHDTVVVSEDFKVMGELIADSIQAVGDTIFLDDWVTVNGGIRTDSIELGGVVLNEWPTMFPTLDDAYDNYPTTSKTINVDDGRIYMIGGDSQTLYVRNTSDTEEALRVYNAGDGPAMYCSGDLQMSGAAGAKIFSSADINFQLDEGGDDFLNEDFTIRTNDWANIVFRVNELGEGAISKQLTTPFVIADSIRLGGVTRTDWPGGAGTADDDWDRTGHVIHSYDMADSVGIGTATPSAKVHILGESSDYETLLMVENNATGADDVYAGWFTSLDVGDGYGTGILAQGHRFGVQGQALGIGPFEYVGVLGMADGECSGTNIGVKGVADNSSVLDIGVYGSAPGTAGTSWAGYFVQNVWVGGILEAGGIDDGVSTGTAGHVLTADGSGGFTWEPASGASDTDWFITGTDMYSNVDGNVGIGTATPTHKLHIVGDDNDVLRIEGVDGSWGHGGKINFGDEDYVYISEAVDDELRFYADNAVFDVIGVGINTTTPAYALDVEGDFGLSGGLYDGADMGTVGQVLTADGAGGLSWEDPIAGSDGDWTVLGSDVYAAVSGNVGIGTPAPEQKLHVFGDVRLEGGIVDATGTGTTDQILTADGSGGWSWEDNPGATSLQDAYDGGVVINIGTAEMEINKITADSDRLLDITNNDPDDEAVRIYNMATDGIALYCSGNLRMNSADYIVSRADLKFIVDYAGTTSTTNKFAIFDQSLNEFFSIDETGKTFIKGGIDDGSGSTGSMNQVLTADGFGNMSWRNIPTPPAVRFDTLVGTVHDTIVVNSDLKVVGELVVDSLQAVGDIVYVDDSLLVRGAIDLPMSDYGSPMYPMQTSRTDWEVANVITVGSANADFTDIEVALNYANDNSPCVVKVAPGIYTITSVLTLDDVAISGSSCGNTTITGAGSLDLTRCWISDITMNIPLDLEYGKADNSVFGFEGGNITFLECELHGCDFTTSADVLFDSNTKVTGSRIMTQASCWSDGVSLTSCLITDLLYIASATDAVQHIDGCRITNQVNVATAAVHLFLSSSDISGQIMLMAGKATIEGNRFTNSEMPSIIVMEGGKAHITENDFAAPLQALMSSMASEIIFKGNVVKGTTTTMYGVNISGVTGFCYVEDNDISGAMQVGIELNNMMTPTLGTVVVKNNTVTACGTGVALGFTAPTVQALVTHNVLVNNLTYDLWNAGTSIVSHNVIGIYLPLGPYSGALNTRATGTIWNDPPPVGQSLGQLP